MVAQGSPHDCQKKPSLLVLSRSIPLPVLSRDGVFQEKNNNKKSLFCFSLDSEQKSLQFFQNPDATPRYNWGKIKFNLKMIIIKDQLTQRPLSYSKISIYCILLRKKRACCCLKFLTPSSHYISLKV